MLRDASTAMKAKIDAHLRGRDAAPIERGRGRMPAMVRLEAVALIPEHVDRERSSHDLHTGSDAGRDLHELHVLGTVGCQVTQVQRPKGASL